MDSKMKYERPCFEIVDVRAEYGFAVSDHSGTTDPMDYEEL